MVQCSKCAQWEHIACTFSSPDATSQSVFLCHCCKSDVSCQCTPPVDHRSTQNGNAPSICNCSCALEVSQLKQEVLDMKVQMKNQLEIIYNAVMLLSNAPTLDPALSATPLPQHTLLPCTSLQSSTTVPLSAQPRNRTDPPPAAASACQSHIHYSHEDFPFKSPHSFWDQLPCFASHQSRQKPLDAHL